MIQLSSKPLTALLACALALLAGCATNDPFNRRGAAASPDGPLTVNNAAIPTAPLPTSNDDAIRMKAKGGDAVAVEKPKPEIKAGTGKFINERAAGAPRPTGGGGGDVSFNFENQPIQAVVKAILGEMLQENYIIAPNVGGNVTFSTSRPIRADQAMSVLETLLSWTGNTLVYENGRYTVLQLKDALPGKLTPRFGGVEGRGYEVRVFPLRYVSPTQMANLLKPYAKPEAIINADTSRSMIVMAGTPSELDNYRRTIETFDVDWLKGMSIGVFALQHQEVAKLLPQLSELFGPEGESPLAGMFRFIPLEQGNSLVVITPNPEYLAQAEDWLNRLDTGATENSNQLYVYNVKNIKSPDLAGYLNEIFLGASPSSGSSSRSRTSGSVGPGQRAVTIGGLGGAGGSLSGSRGALNERPQPTSTPAATTPAAGATPGVENQPTIRISAIEENNQLMVMASPAEWNSIQSAIRKLDISPLQVQIEARILEVSLSGDLQYGVQWWFQGLQGTGNNYQNGDPYVRPYDRQRGLLGAAGPGTAGTIFSSYLNSKFEVALSALEKSGNAKALAAPSLVVANNQEAQINVGTQIPVVQTFYNPGLGLVNPGTGTGTGGTTGVNNYGNSGSVQYLNTGVILSVTPRVNPGGLVYLDIQQEVSNPGTPAQGSSNPPINQRQLQTQIAVQSGETLLLGGLIQENNTYSDSSVPLLGKIPVLGKLFGSTTKHTDRTELIVLITPRVITNSEEAREMTEEYQQRFQSLRPLEAKLKSRPGELPAATPRAVLPAAQPATPEPRRPVEVMPLHSNEIPQENPVHE